MEHIYLSNEAFPTIMTEAPDVELREDVLAERTELMKAEPVLTNLNDLHHDAEDEKTDLKDLALHHAFGFLS